MLDPLWYLNGIISAFLCNLSSCCLPSSFCSKGYMVWKKMMFKEFQDGCLVLGNLGYANGMILRSLPSSLCSRRYMVWKVLVEEFQDGYLMLDSPWHLTGMNSAFCVPYLPAASRQVSCLRGYMVWKKLFEKFQEGCFVHDHLLYLSEMKEAFMSIVLPWSIQSSFCSWGHMVWRRMLFDKYQDCCLVLGHPDILFNLSLHVCLVSAQEDIWFWRSNCLKNSKMAV